MRPIGIDLAVTGAHTAVVVDEQDHFVSHVIKFRSEPTSLQR